jgi:hypothetical protein
MEKENVRETNRQWAIRISEHRDSEKLRLDKMSQDDVNYEFQRGKWVALCDLLSSEFSKSLLDEI